MKSSIAKLKNDEILAYESTKTITISGNVLNEGDLIVKRKYKLDQPDLASGGDDDMILVMNCVMNPHLLQVGAARELINHIQKQRKASKLNVEDEIVLFYETPGEYYSKILEEQAQMLQNGLKIQIQHKLEV